jgi:hypothetical protein
VSIWQFEPNLFYCSALPHTRCNCWTRPISALERAQLLSRSPWQSTLYFGKGTHPVIAA